MTHMHADDLIKEMKDQQMRLAEEHHRNRDLRRHFIDAQTNVFAEDVARRFRESEGTALDEWRDTLAPGFEDKPRPWRIEGPMFAAAVLMASAVIFCLAVIGLLALIFPGAFA